MSEDVFAEAARRAGAGAASLPSAAPAPRGEMVLRHNVNDPTEMAVAVDLVTGEVYPDPAEITTDNLAQLAYHLRIAEKNQQKWTEAVERELRNRLKREGRRRVTVGGYELEVKVPHSRQWDTEELAGVVAYLVEQDVLKASEVAELIKHERKVNGTLAVRLLERLVGEPHDALARCFEWKDGTPKVNVTPAALAPGEGAGGE